jgi:outer membrane protein assembly factor BamB
MRNNYNTCLVLLLLVTPLVKSQHVSQWRGPDRNGTYYETNLLKQWPEQGPDLLWFSEDIGTGHSSASVTEDRVFVTGRKDTLEYLSSFDLEGNLQWEMPFGRAWTGSFPDSRSTPNVVGGKIYVVSGMAEVVCLDAHSGEIIWKVDAREEYGGLCTMWGFCESPVVYDDKVIFTPGGMQTTMVALDRSNGRAIWTSDCLKDSVGYVSPLLINHNNRKILASISANFFYGMDAENGNLLWKFSYKEFSHMDHSYSPIININTPLYNNGEIYITKGYDHEGIKFSISEDGNSIEQLWRDTILDVHLGGITLVNGYLYGSNWLHNGDGNWCSVDWETGTLMYETHWENKGAVIFADDLLYCYEEKRGRMALVRPTPEKFDVISSFKTAYGSGPAWAHPVIKDGILYVRRGKAIMAYDIRS